MKQATETFNELFAAWDFTSDGDIVVREDAPEWIHSLMRYIAANMNEQRNNDTNRLLHRFSAVALKNVDKADKVGVPSYLQNASTIALDSIPGQLHTMLEWLSFNHGARAHFVDEVIANEAFEFVDDFNSLLWAAYARWGQRILSHAETFLLTVR